MADSEYAWKVGDRVRRYTDMNVGVVLKRTIETNPRYGDEEDYYWVDFGNEKRWCWNSQLEVPPPTDTPKHGLAPESAATSGTSPVDGQ